MSWDSADQALARLKSKPAPYQDNYLGFYSSYLGGFFKEPWAMQLPIDDHGFHRGDGIFEAVRIFDRAFFELPAHLLRLQRSAQAIDLTLPHTLDEILKICVKLGGLTGTDTGVLRLFATRGPGSFTPNPKDCEAAQFYAVITKLKPLPTLLIDKGARAMISTVAAKDAYFSRIKSFNYLQNVLMKKECVEKGFDFAISVDATGRVCEGATENFAIVKDGELLIPDFDYTLHGITVTLAMELAEELVKDGTLKAVRTSNLSRGDLAQATEAAVIGTTLGVLPVTSIDGKNVGGGAPGPIFTRLRATVMEAMAKNPKLRTSF